MDSVVAEIEQRLEGYEEPVEVAVLGCAVNGIGEASHADFGIAGAKNEGLIFAGGKPLRKVPQENLVDTLFEEIDKSLDRGGEVEFDEAESREGAEWVAKIEQENAGDLTPEKIAADGEGSGRTRRVGQGPARRGGLADRGPPLHPGLARIDSPAMAKNKNAISPARAEDFPAWFQAVVSEAEVAELAHVRGCMVIRPWGYAIWELMQRELDREIKATGAQNAYFPLFIPLSYFEEEAEHVEGFAKEMAVVTHHRLEATPTHRASCGREASWPSR